jgi:hypothetical protein
MRVRVTTCCISELHFGKGLAFVRVDSHCRIEQALSQGRQWAHLKTSHGRV